MNYDKLSQDVKNHFNEVTPLQIKQTLENIGIDVSTIIKPEFDIVEDSESCIQTLQDLASTATKEASDTASHNIGYTTYMENGVVVKEYLNCSKEIINNK